jgi:predicted NBD/HSP70 family sugar kinase
VTRDNGSAGPAGQQTVRRHNLGLVLAELARSHGSRAELAQRTGLTKATVASLVDSLVAHGLLSEGEPVSSGPGRPSRALGFNPAGPVAIGVEINVDHLTVCVLDLTGGLRVLRTVPSANRALSAADALGAAGRLVCEVLSELDRPLLGIGLAVPGAVGPDGQLLRAPNLPSLTGTFPGVALAELTGVADVLVENEANLGALARLWTPPDSGPDFVYVSGEVGVGAGLIVGGELFRGVAGYAGELGHVVVERDGPACGCGGQGCVEQYAGQDVLLRRADQPDLESLEAALARGDRHAGQAVAEAGAALGVGLASMLNVVDLPMVELGGVYARLYHALLPALGAELSRRVLSMPDVHGHLRRSTLGADAAVRGGAGTVLDRALKDPDRLTASVGSSGSSSPSRTRGSGRVRAGSVNPAG